MKAAIEEARNELAHLNSDPGEKKFDSEAPLLVAEALIQAQFLWEGHRTLHYCSDTFFQWDGRKYVEMTEDEMRQKIYSFLRDAKALSNTGGLENFNPNKFKVDQVVDALRAICYHNHHPANGAIWLDGREDPNPHYLISFNNGLLNMEEWLENPSGYF